MNNSGQDLVFNTAELKCHFRAVNLVYILEPIKPMSTF